MKQELGLWTAALLGAGLLGGGLAASSAHAAPPAKPAPVVAKPAPIPAKAAPAAAKVRSPRNQCRLACRKTYAKNVKRIGGQKAFRERGACYNACRRNHPPTNPVKK